jgi:hypothetical protein
LARQLATILKEWDFRSTIVEEYFILTCHDIIAGVPLKELYISVDLFEELEAYEECEGILLACQLCTTLTLTNYLNKEEDDDHKNVMARSIFYKIAYDYLCRVGVRIGAKNYVAKYMNKNHATALC